MNRPTHSGYLGIAFYFFVLFMELLISFLYPNSFSSFPCVSSFLAAHAHGLFGDSLVFFTIPFTQALLYFVIYKTLEVNDKLLKITSISMIAEAFISSYFLIKMKNYHSLFIIFSIVKIVLSVTVLVKIVDHHDSIRRSISYKPANNECRKKLLSFSKWLNAHAVIQFLMCFLSVIVLTIIAIVFKGKWIAVAGIVCILIDVILENISGYCLLVNQITKNRRKEVVLFEYDEEYALKNGIDYSSIMLKMFLFCILPVVSMYTVAFYCYSYNIINHLFNGVWIIVYVLVIIIGTTWYCHNYKYIQVKNAYFVRTNSGTLHKRIYDHANYDVRLNNITIERTCHNEWQCTYLEDGKMKRIRIPKAYVGLLESVEKNQHTTLEAVKMLGNFKKEKGINFRESITENLAHKLKDSTYAQLVPYYAVSDGFRLSDEYVFFSYSESIDKTAELKNTVNNNEGIDIGSGWIAVAEASNGDKVILNEYGRIIRTNHESVLEIDTEWESLAAFICLSLK